MEAGQQMIVSQPTNMSIADYCAAMDRNEIRVNKAYQRSDKVWPDTARSYLMESILLGYPLPKFYLHFITDVKNRRTIKEIVDGQQRSRAIHDFYNDKFKLSNSLDTKELRGHTYSTLSEEWQSRFISYSISIDQFVGAESPEVRQVFRRMNSYTVPLNPEELRHAENQGVFKWFISRIAGTYSDALSDLEVFSDKQIVRMQDLKLFTEICHAIEKGITTTSRKSLDTLYRNYDENFPEQDEFSKVLKFAFDSIAAMKFLKSTNLAKHYQVYSLALALVHLQHPIPGHDAVEKRDIDPGKLEQRLLELADALDLTGADANASKFKAFIEASVDRTNVKDQRETRFGFYLTALQESMVA
jgi:hypothetical protein